MALNLPIELISAIQEGRAVLFLGAGASRGARNAEGDEIPDAEGLADRLASEMLGQEYRGRGLRFVYDLACSERDVLSVQRRMFEILNPFQPAEFHLKIPTFAWAGIATTNYDLLIERAYARAAPPALQKLVPHVKDGDGATDQLADRSVLYVKLHGCLTRHQEVSPPLVTSTEQLIAFREGRNGQFATFLEWAKTKSIIFTGYSFLDPNLRTLLDEVIKQGDNRPRHYMINKGILEKEVNYWRERRIHAIDGKFEDFLETIDQRITKNQRSLSAANIVSTESTSFRRFITVSGVQESAELRNYIGSFIEHVGPELDPKPEDARRFYSGFDIGWYSIAADLDVRQSVVDDVLSEHIATASNSGRQKMVVIKGHAGSGKSVALRRLCWEAAKKYDRLCFFISRQHMIQIDRFEEIFSLTNFPIFLFVDNIADHRDRLLRLMEVAQRSRTEVRIIGAETFPIWNSACDELEPFVTQAPEMRYLSEANIRALIDKLEKHRSLGYLAELPPEERFRELEHRHGRQLLVALLEATHGTPLEEIITAEYRTIPSERARLLYLDICSLHRFGPPVRAGLIARIHDISFDEFREELFKPLQAIVVLRKDSRSGDFVYEARHSYIAHTVYQTAIKSMDERFDGLLRILRKLNPSFSYDLDVIGKILRAENLERTLSDHAKIRQVYDVAKDSIGELPVLLHQRGIFEMHVANNLGGLDVAEGLLKEAEEKEPYNRAIKHSQAEVDLKRSRLANDPLQKRAWRLRSVERARLLAKGSSPYPHHTLLKAAIDEVKEALDAAEVDQGEATTQMLGESIANAESVLRSGLQAFPNEAILLSEEGELSKVLSMAMRAEKSFEKAFDANPRSTLIAKRLSRIKRSKRSYSEARTVLQRALEHNPGAQDLHYDLAMAILESSPDADQIEGQLIAHHLRRSFTAGDRNRQAQFWYARQLSISNCYDEAKVLFRKLAEARIPFKEKKEVRAPVLQPDGSPRIYTGTITRISGGSFLRCDALNLTAYFSLAEENEELTELLAVGDAVRFKLAFNLLGPVAVELQI